MKQYGHASQPGAADLSHVNARDAGNICTPSAADIFDALCYVKEGTFDRFCSIVRNLNDEAWFPFELLRSFSALGHIDCELDLNSLRPSHWRVPDPVLCVVGPSEFVLSGWRSDGFLSQVEGAAKACGGKLEAISHPEQIPAYKVTGIAPDDAADFASIISENSLFPVKVSSDFSRRLLQMLPTLAQLKLNLPSVSMPRNDLHAFNFDRGNWEPVRDTIGSGAFRSSKYGIRYFYLPPGKGERQALLCDARLSKYLAATDRGIRLLGYDPEYQSLTVPYGMGLPGLYERCSVMCTGLPPVRHAHGITYQGVPQDVAEGILYKCLARQ